MLISATLAVMPFTANAASNMETARKHSISADRPSPGFFEGALIGNGAMGVVVTTRPDAVCMHFGHNNVWDIRVTENHQDEFGTFAEIFAKADRLSPDLPSIQHDREFADYLSMTADNYRSPYPRPFPCGSLLLGFDPRRVELTGHELDIADGICRVTLLDGGEKRILSIFTDMERDSLWVALSDSIGNPVPSCFNRLRILPDPSTPGDIPHYEIVADTGNAIGFMQRLPYSTAAPDTDKDKAFALVVNSSAPLTGGTRTSTLGQQVPLADMERYIAPSASPLMICATLAEGSAAAVEKEIVTALPQASALASCIEANLSHWNDYWNCSGVNLADSTLEEIWYRNLYFYNCALRPGVTCPGIFANWSYGNIGTAWHGDYHLNYNTQQPFWLPFSSNHLDKNLVYADLVDHLLPVSRKWAKEYYGMRGAFFPHSAYPVEMHTHPYPVPDWGWEVFETPWMVQGLWWHYLYSGDTAFLRDRAFTPMKDAVMFLVDYMSRPDAHGAPRWNDDRNHIFPSVPPELYGLQPGFKFNYDTQIDIALTKFLFDAYLEAIDILSLQKSEKELARQVRQLRDNLPDYSTFESPVYGTIFTSVPGEEDGIVYNVPASLANVFPGEEYGIGTPDSIMTILRNTVAAHQNEGGNDIVFLPMQKARLGMLDLDKFKRQVRYATLPNGTVTDAVLQTGGRYSDYTDYMYMAGMGIWFENFALPAVINECLMQSYDGRIRLFPNWNLDDDASFSTLRARGGFLVSAEVNGGRIGDVEIYSNNGGKCRVVNPWPGASVSINNGGCKFKETADGIIEFDTHKGESYTIARRL